MIIALEDAKYKLVGMRAEVKELGSALKIDELRVIAAELDEKTLDPNFWSDQENSGKVMQKCGMKYEGTLKDAIKVKGKFKTISIFAITKKEYSFILREKIRIIKEELGEIFYGRNIRNYYGRKLWRFMAYECYEII